MNGLLSPRNLWAEIEYKKELETTFSDPKKIAERMANIDALIDGIEYYENRDRKPTLEGYLRQVSLMEEDDDEEYTQSKFQAFMEKNQAELGWTNQGLNTVSGSSAQYVQLSTVGGKAG